jgi:hypothetical protein
MSSIALPRSWTLSEAPAWVLAALLAAIYLVISPPSADLAAQTYRSGLGLVLWDGAWYGGHHVPAYSVLFPPLAALLGPQLVGALAAVAAAWLFQRLVDGLEGARVASLWFAVGTATTLLTGRLTFALGVAVGLAALVVAKRGLWAAASVLAVMTSLASPVAGAFVALAAAAWWVAKRGWPPLAVGTAAIVPVAATTIAFPEGGTFPFVPSSFWPSLAAVVALSITVPREARIIRAGVALYALAMVASFAVATPMGGNVVRLGALFAGPVLAGLLWTRDRRALALLALPLVYWQWVAPVDDWARAASDPSVHQRYYAGLIGYLGTREGGPFRVEIPFTDNHWESRWVAPRIPLARGWERQVDRQRNSLFYDDEPLTPWRYENWLDNNAVKYVALPDAPLDYSAQGEARLIRSGLPYLRQVWHDAHWRVFAVEHPRALASGAARVTSITAQQVRLYARRTGSVDLRVRFTPYWNIAYGRGCVEQGEFGWTRLLVDKPGRIVLDTRFAIGRVRADSPRCTRGVKAPKTES